MENFEDTLTWILTDFKKGKTNYAQTILKIEEFIAEQLGLTMYYVKVANETAKELEE